MTETNVEEHEKVEDIKRVKTPTVIQMEAVECGAAALGIILGHFGRHVPLEELRVACGVSRDGSKALNIMRAAERYGLEAEAYRMELEELSYRELPVILFWNFDHFLVLEGVKGDKVFLNDPGMGPRVVSQEEFDRGFTGVVLTFTPGENFVKDKKKKRIFKALQNRTQGARSALGYTILAGLGLVLPGLVTPFFIKIFVDEILVRNMTTWVMPLLTAMVVTALLKGILMWLQAHFLLKLQTRMALMESSKFFWHLLKLPMEFFAQRMAGDIGNRLAINDRLAILLTGKLTTAVLDVFLVVFYMGLMFYYDVQLTLVGVAIAALNLIFLRLVSRKRIDEKIKLMQEDGKLMGTGINGLVLIETLKATGSEADFFSKWAGYHTKVLNSEQKLGRLTYQLMAVPPFLTALNTVIILSLGGLRVMDGLISMGMLVAFQSLMQSFIQPINNLVWLGADIQNAESDMNRLDDVLSYKEAPLNAEEERMGEHAKLSGEVVFRDITFGYSALEEPLIKGFNLNLKPGSRVALVGKSGSGKSTISNLAAGLYQPWSGEILFDGLDRNQHPRMVIMNSVAMVDQQIFLFEGKVRENLTMWDNTLPEEDVVQAAKDAQIHDEIATRLGSYESAVSEGGSNFSGGQRQRLEIARALAVNPSILILDEATSALDPKTEKMVDDSIRRRGCTCLVVAHRLSTIRDCDEIIVMDRGEIVQRGTHEEMAVLPGLYADLIKTI